jgi:hypothetical protein
MSSADGTVIGKTQIVNSGPANQRWNLVILGDGYKTGEMGKFATDAQTFVNTLFATPPFDELRSGINVYRVDVSSTDSGADDPAACGGTGASAATYFDSSFCTNGAARLLVADSATAVTVASAQVPQWNQIMVIVNSSKYGGSGGHIAVFSTEASAAQIGIHEMGHSAFGLTDEYEYYLGCGTDTTRNNHPANEPAAANATINSDSATIKWKDLIASATAVPTTSNPDCTKCDPRTTSPVAAGTVGAFEGADYYHCGAYRPEFNCKMHNLSAPFCAVCRRRITQTLSPFLAPAVTGLAPASGPSQGGTSVVITGTGFNGALGVRFGSTAASSFNVDSDTQITAVSPAANVSGDVDVKVTTNAGASNTTAGDHFTYLDGAAPAPANAPTVTGLSPANGPGDGGTTVVITGTGFTGASDVSFGSTAADSFNVDSDTQITAVSPAANMSGVVDVTVTTSAGSSSATSDDQFTFD